MTTNMILLANSVDKTLSQLQDVESVSIHEWHGQLSVSAYLISGRSITATITDMDDIDSMAGVVEAFVTSAVLNERLGLDFEVFNA